LYVADVNEGLAAKVTLGRHKIDLSEVNFEKARISPAIFNDREIRVVGSRSHMNEDTENFVESLKKPGVEVDIVSKGSSLKFCLVAEGKADVYPRFAPTMEWDTAAGQAICEAAGLKVISKETDEPLLYNKENLLNPWFIVQ
jgi:3'(2'), 5'-bisphosphate nucleotidase